MLFIDTRYLLHKTTPFLFGWLGDRLLGDPEGWPHPIVWFGKAIAYGERHLNRGNDRILKGGILAVTLIAGIYFLTYGILYFAGVIHPVISGILTAIGVFFCLAGKTLKIRVTVHAIKQRKLPEINDELAKQVGAESMDKLRASIRDSYAHSRENAVRSAAQKKMLDKMLAGLEFPLPESLLDMQIRTLIAETAARLEQQGKKLADLGKTEDELRKDMYKQAEELTRIQVLLLSIARKEGLTVTQTELDNQLYRICIQTGEDYRKVREAYERTGMIHTMRDRLLADKGMEAAFAKASVKEVEPMKEITPVKKDTAPAAD